MYLVIGRTASGKTTLTDELAKRGLRVVESYTTRPKRTPDETGHTFITKEEAERLLPNAVATSELNGNLYFATREQIENADVYVIDPNGAKELTENMPDIPFQLIYISATPNIRRARYEARGNAGIDFDAREAEETEQFDAFETDLDNIDSMAKNITGAYICVNADEKEQLGIFVDAITQLNTLQQCFADIMRLDNTMFLPKGQDPNLRTIFLTDTQTGKTEKVEATINQAVAYGITDAVRFQAMLEPIMINFAPTIHAMAHAATDPASRSQCPRCKSSDIEGGFVEIEGTHAFQHCECHECSCRWTDTYDYANTTCQDEGD